MSESGLLIAIIVAVFVFSMPAFSRELRRRLSILLCYWFVVALHEIVAFTNALWFTTLGADADAETFHRIAVELAQSGEFTFAVGSTFYENMLGSVYWLLGPSQLLGEQLSVLAFAVSSILLLKILRMLGPSRHEAVVLLAFGALPSMVLFGSVTLRESYEVLFFMITVYSGLILHKKGGLNVYFFALVLAGLITGLFHKGLVVYSVFLIAMFLIWSLRPVSRFWNVKKLRLIAVLIVPVLLTGVVVLSRMQLSGLGALVALINMDLLDAASTYRETSVSARATYGVALDLSSPFSAAYSSMVLYVHYLFAPFPWKIGNILDAYASVESLLRMSLIYFSLKHWKNAIGTHRRLLGLMLIFFFSMSTMWAMGTSNYGTAMRHHMLSWWIIVIVGLPSMMEKLARVQSGLSVHVHSHSLELVEKTS